MIGCLQISTILNWQSENFAFEVEIHHRRKFMVNKNYLRSIVSLICTSSFLIFSVVGSKGAPGDLGFSFLNRAKTEREWVEQKISQSMVKFEANSGQYD